MAQDFQGENQLNYLQGKLKLKHEYYLGMTESQFEFLGNIEWVGINFILLYNVFPQLKLRRRFMIS